jgi:hypothetical protein
MCKDGVGKAATGRHVNFKGREAGRLIGASETAPGAVCGLTGTVIIQDVEKR